MSSTFATKSGSLDILKLRTRCGLRPCSAQMRCTLVWLMPISSAIDRTLQCVALAGGLFTVFSAALGFMAALGGFWPGGLVRPFLRPPPPHPPHNSPHRPPVLLKPPTPPTITHTP